MKILAVDVGNTSTAVGVWQNGRVGSVCHLDGPVEEVTEACAALVARSPKFSGVAYASVVPKKDAFFRAQFRRLGLQTVPIGHESFLRYQASSGLKLDYRQPSEIGADRFADAAGAFARYGCPVLIMDFGTALTAAVITRDRVWRGGVIAPGFPLMRDYLFERTAKLPRMAIGGRLPRIGRSTEEAMRFGALVGYRGMVREIVTELKGNFGEDFRLVATGGYAKWALKGAGMPFMVDADLTLFGIGLIAERTLS